jgi:hypothetical protein
MATTTSGNPQDDPARKREDARDRSAGRVEKFGGLDPALFSPQPVPAEVAAGPGRNDPALQEAFDAFDGAKLPRPPLAKLTGLTPADGLDTLRTLVKYLDATCDPVANVVHLVLSELRGQSFGSLVGTKELAKLVQWLADRTGYVITCPKCDEPARLVTAPHSGSTSSLIRYRHTGATHSGAGSLPDPSLRRLDRPE